MSRWLLLSALILGTTLQTSATARATSQGDIVETAVAAGDFKTLVAALKAADLVAALRGDGPFTVLAPTDAAFAKLPKKVLAELLEPRNRDQLTAILKYHVVAGRVLAADAVTAKLAKTLQGETVTFAIQAGRLTAQRANVIANDISTRNGVIHAIDTVLMPPSLSRPEGRLVIGIHSERPSRVLAAQLRLDRQKALVVTGVTAKSTAEVGGLLKYDVITAINGRAATEAWLKEAKEAVGYDGTLHVVIVREGRPTELDIKVGVEKH